MPRKDTSCRGLLTIGVTPNLCVAVTGPRVPSQYSTSVQLFLREASFQLSGRAAQMCGPHPIRPRDYNKEADALSLRAFLLPDRPNGDTSRLGPPGKPAPSSGALFLQIGGLVPVA